MADEHYDMNLSIKSEANYDIDIVENEDINYSEEYNNYDNGVDNSEEKHASYRVGSSSFKTISDQELNMQLIKEVEKHELLYNYNHDDYSKRDMTDKAWQAVATKVNMSVVDCKEKWRNIRTVFVRRMKVPLNRKGKKRPSYYLADALKFCLPYIKSLTLYGSANHAEVPHSEHAENSARLSWDSYTQDDPSDSSHAAPTAQEDFPAARSPTEALVLPDQSTQSSVRSSSSQHKRMLKRRKKPPINVNACVAEYFKAKRAKLESKRKEEKTISNNVEKKEALKMFLLSLLPELEDFSDSQIKLFKRQVFGVIDGISNSSQFGESRSSVSSRVSVTSEPSRCSSVSRCSDLSRL